MHLMSTLLVAMAIVGMFALGRLLARALEAVDDAKDPLPPPLKRDDLGARLLRASIEGPKDRP